MSGDQYPDVDPDEDSHIAVIGMAGRYPKSGNLAEFWDNLAQGVDFLDDVSDADLDEAGIPASIHGRPGFVKRGTRFPHADCFDAAFFGFIPREARAIDPQARVFLETAYEAIEDAGYDPWSLQGSVGIFAGASNSEYDYLMKDPDPTDLGSVFEAMIGAGRDYLATRVSHKLDLKGPAITVQTACSTSLVAIHQAVQSLLNHESSMCLAGGVSLSFGTSKGYMFQEGMILSPDGRCRAFDAKAQGTTPGQGCGVVLLKRLADAVADKDRIYAIVRGSAINNDGSEKIGFTAPSEIGQSRVIALAQQVAGVSPDTIGYVETHGTGTVLGDPIEIAALRRAFSLGTDRKQYCAIGSVKSSLGHTDTAAGVTGFIKTVLSLHHRKILPNRHYEQPNPAIDFDDSPFYVSSALSDWTQSASARRAGVSSFGIGGTNAHVVLEEWTSPAVQESAAQRHALPLSARTPEALASMTANLQAYLESDNRAPLGDVAWTLQNGRPDFEFRTTLVARVGQAETASGERKPLDVLIEHAVKGSAQTHAPQTVWMFPGQGAQYSGMCSGLYEGNQVFRKATDQCAALFEPLLEQDIRTLIFDKQNDVFTRSLSQTAFTQPALFTVQYGLSRLLRSWGLTPDAVIGHSVGEFCAAVAAGIMSLEHAVFAVFHRARLMQSMEEGSMLSVAMTAQALREILPDGIELAAENAPQTNVVAGPSRSIEQFSALLEERQIDCTRVSTSHAFHSRMMSAAADEFASTMRNVPLSIPETPMVSNVSGTWLTDEQALDPDYWASQITAPVRFGECVRTAQERDSDDVQKTLYLEVGPGRTLSGLVKANTELDQERVRVMHTVRHRSSDFDDEGVALAAAGHLWAEGVALDWSVLGTPGDHRKTSLPTYPFARDRHWAPEQTNVFALEHPRGARPTSAAPVPTSQAELVASQTMVSVQLQFISRQLELLAQASALIPQQAISPASHEQTNDAASSALANGLDMSAPASAPSSTQHDSHKAGSGHE